MSAIATVTSTSSSSQAPPPLWKPASVAPRALPALPALDDLPVSQTQCDKAMNALVKHVDKVQKKRDDEDLLGEQDEKVFLVVGLKQAPKREVHKPVRMCVSIELLLLTLLSSGPPQVESPRRVALTPCSRAQCGPPPSPQPARPARHPLRKGPAALLQGPPRRAQGRLHHARRRPRQAPHKAQDVRGKEAAPQGGRALPRRRQGHGRGGQVPRQDVARRQEVRSRLSRSVSLLLGTDSLSPTSRANRQPIPVALQRKDLKAELERAVASTYMNVTTGTSLCVPLPFLLSPLFPSLSPS